eukprot:3602834-Amphidinium_carterae.1
MVFISGRSPTGHEFQGARAPQARTFTKRFSSADADVIHPGSGRSAYFSTIQPHTAKGFGYTSLANS